MLSEAPAIKKRFGRKYEEHDGLKLHFSTQTSQVSVKLLLVLADSVKWFMEHPKCIEECACINETSPACTNEPRAACTNEALAMEECTGKRNKKNHKVCLRSDNQLDKVVRGCKI